MLRHWRAAQRARTGAGNHPGRQSGGVNPLKYRTAGGQCSSEWFTEHPLYDNRGQPIVVPEWQFGGRGNVRPSSSGQVRGQHTAEKVACAATARQAGEMAAKLEERKQEIERAKEYVLLYGRTQSCEALYQVDNLLAMWKALSPADQATFGFDPRSSTGRSTSTTCTCRGWSNTLGSRPHRSQDRNDRADRMRRNVLAPQRHVAAFDLENTLIASTWSRVMPGLPPVDCRADDRTRFVLTTLAEAPSAGAGPQGSRRLPPVLLPRYEDAPVEQLDEDSQGTAHATHRHQELPGGHPPGARATVPLVTARC